MKNLGLNGLLMFTCLLLFFLQTSCNSGRVKTRTDTLTEGVARLVADESFAPIINEEIDVFESLNPEAILMPTYAGEEEAYKLLMNDSIQLLFGTRELTANEQNIIKERKQKPRTQIFAVDGIAIIVNNANTDSLITVNDLKRIMTGEIRSWKDLNPNSKLGDIEISFDSPNSSIVRFIRDSICAGTPLGTNVKARSENQMSHDLDSITPNQKVVDFVAKNPNALGIVGVNWVINPNDPLQLSFTNKVQVMAVSRDNKAFSDNSYKPLPYQLALKKYPLRRELYIIITDVQGGLPSGFVKFAAGDQGQRIVLRSGLLPGIAPARLVRINATAN